MASEAQASLQGFLARLALRSRQAHEIETTQHSLESALHAARALEAELRRKIEATEAEVRESSDARQMTTHAAAATEAEIARIREADRAERDAAAAERERADRAAAAAEKARQELKRMVAHNSAEAAR
jgi:hypothetical protein